MTVRVDFSRLLSRMQPSKLSRELLVRAARIKGLESPPYAIDATAGFGEDSFLLAAAGYQVTMIEREPEIVELLQDGLLRATEDERLATIASRMELVEGDATELMRDLKFCSRFPRVDLIYLDPMFPHKRKAALAKKKLQYIQTLEDNSPENDAALLAAARELKARKIVVKRPLKAASLDEQKPSYTVCGKLIRFDCYA